MSPLFQPIALNHLTTFHDPQDYDIHHPTDWVSVCYDWGVGGKRPFCIPKQCQTLKDELLMNYQTFQPHPDLESLVKCYWTLEISAEDDSQRQRIIPDGCIEMAFILGDDIKRYLSEDEFILQPRAMVLGQTIAPFYIEPVGYVKTFAVSFYPYGFANFITEPIKNLVNKETSIAFLFGETSAKELERKILQATDTLERIKFIEEFLFAKLNGKTTIDNIVKTTIDTLLSTLDSTRKCNRG